MEIEHTIKFPKNNNLDRLIRQQKKKERKERLNELLEIERKYKKLLIRTEDNEMLISRMKRMLNTIQLDTDKYIFTEKTNINNYPIKYTQL